MNVALTDLAALMVSLQTPVPEHAPDQPANFEPADGVAVNVTFVPSRKDCEHVEPQLMPGVLEATVPEPVPALVTFNVL